MLDVALISELSHHKLQAQKDAYPDFPHFVGPDEIPMMLRPSRRQADLNIHVVSLAVIAINEKHFREFLTDIKTRRGVIHIKDTNSIIVSWHVDIKGAVKSWKAARRNGAAKAGGDAKSEISEKQFWEGFARIVDRWHMPSKGSNANKPLLKEADTSRNTVKSYLGHTRVEWQGFSDTRRRRILKEKAKWPTKKQ